LPGWDFIQVAENACLKKCVFKRDLKSGSVDKDVTVGGKAFQICGQHSRRHARHSAKLHMHIQHAIVLEGMSELHPYVLVAQISMLADCHTKLSMFINPIALVIGNFSLNKTHHQK
jgi:hypothetical protein